MGVISNGMKVTAVVVAAGVSKRMKGYKKIFTPLNKKPLIVHTLDVLNKSTLIKDIILVVNRKNIKEANGQIVSKYRLKKVSKITSGGVTRAESVYKGLKEIDNNTELVLIHDGARPFITKKIIKDSVLAAKRFGASVVGVPVTSTIKKAKKNLFVDSTLPRKNLWWIQTPQVFQKQLIFNAYNRVNLKTDKITDDSSLIEKKGHRVKIVMGSYENIKITTPHDLVIAKEIIKTNGTRRHRI